MKKLLFTLLIVLIWSGLANAETLKWDASTGGPDGYIVYYTNGTQTWNKSTVETEMDLAELNLTPGTYSMWVTAYNDMGESGPSETLEHNKAAFIPPPDNIKPVTLIVPKSAVNVTII